MGKKLLVSGGSLIRKTPDPQIKSGSFILLSSVMATFHTRYR